MKTIAVIGASKDRKKFSNKAIHAYKDEGWKVFPVNKEEKKIEGLSVFSSISDIPEPIDRVSVYLPPEVGMLVIDEIAATKPGEVIFNPGTISDELIARARELELNFREVCSIVDIGHNPSEYN